MIAIPRRALRRFRAAAGRCRAGRARGPAPPVVCRRLGGVLTLGCRLPEVDLTLALPAAGRGDELLVVPMAVLDAAGGPGDDPVEIAVTDGLAGTARWVHQGEPRVVEFDALLPGRQHDLPAPPAELHPVGPDFLAALHACGREAARDPARFALHRVQVRGRPGTAAGTDGRAALVWAGLALPFPEDVLVPAVPVFGSPELAGEPDVRVGRTDGRLVVAAGRWAVHLTADTTGRYPDVAGVVPKPSPGAAVATLTAADAARLVDRLPGLPGADEDDRPVTLDLAGRVVVRAGEPAREVRLPGSRVTGPAARVVVDRRPLGRALALGCRTIRVTPGKPVVLDGGGRTFVLVALDPARVVPPADETAESTSAGTPTRVPDPEPAPEPLERRTEMRPETNGHHPPPGPPAGDLPDPLAEAEGLRAALADAAARAGRLVGLLKARKREDRALSQVWTTLRALHPGGRGAGR